MLGVSQPAIARWERGIDVPSPRHLKRLQDLMAGTTQDELTLERLFISRQSSVRALVDFDGIRVLAVSEGFSRLWPESGRLIDIKLADHMVGETSRFIFDEQLRRDICSGSLRLASGISKRHLDLPLDLAIHHQWHLCFRRYGARTLAEIVYEPCSRELPIGVTDLVRIDQLGQTI